MLKNAPLDTLPVAAHPADHKLLSRAVADWLARRIIAGEEAPGARLTEPKLAALAGVSRSPVREALRILAGEGLVELVPRLGAQVARVGREHVTELYACRMLLEPRCAALAVTALTPRDVPELDALRASMESAVAAGDPRRFLSANIDYFRTLLAHCPDATLRELVELTWNKAVRYWSIFSRLPRYGEGSLLQHAALHDAVHARDGDAAEHADRAILERALHAILDTFEQPNAELAGA
ncbi:MAG TPA: GntR family transcriptional regulator [Gaiellaceae bacterium]